MASTEPGKAVELEPKPEPKANPEAPATPPPPPTDICLWTDLALRVLILASVVSAIAVTVTSHQKKVVPMPQVPFPVVEAKFNQSPALEYFVAALAVTGLYSLITALASVCVILNPNFSTNFLPYLLIWDVVILGILASATGAAGAVAYIDLKGNSHVNWNKVCNVFDKFCKYLASSISLGLFASVLLVLLIILSILSLHKKIPK